MRELNCNALQLKVIVEEERGEARLSCRVGRDKKLDKKRNSDKRCRNKRCRNKRCKNKKKMQKKNMGCRREKGTQKG